MRDIDCHMRRRLLSAGAGLALAGAASGAQAAITAPGPLRVAEVIARIRERVAIPWQEDTVDRIVAGTADLAISGIGTTMVASLDVLRRASAQGLNMVVAHEPTFWSHFDTVDGLGGDPAFRHKRDFIAGNGMVVFRFHDHWHAMRPDGIATGMARALGWASHAVAGAPTEFLLPAQTLGEVTTTLSRRLGARSMRVLGDPALSVRRVLAAWGYADLERLRMAVARDEVDLVIVGETREWELVPYIEDLAASGTPKALVVLGHVVSEQAGMAYCAEWLRGFVDEVPVAFVAAAEPLRGHPAPP
jgi:putative NIF3 family GTP cyclohydrolase 1 type 2